MQKFFVIVLFSLLPAGAVIAEELKIPLASQGDPAVKVPGKGMTKAKVESTYGAPEQKYPAVGEPPISRWQYANYTVIFEYNHVVHTVQRHQKRNPTPES